jgi:putative ABC transport system permease protein
MMAAPRSQNRQMFWRILRRLLGANHGRLFVILLALGAGAAVTAALLNLQVDAKHRITSEFRAFGPNVLVVPRNASSSGFPTLSDSIAHSIPVNTASGHVAVSSSLYIVARVSDPQYGKSLSAVVAGTSPLILVKISLNPASERAGSSGMISASTADRECIVGSNVARQLKAPQDAQLVVTYQDRRETCRLASLRETGGPEDDRVRLDLRAAQQLAALPGRISVLELIVPGTPAEIQSYISNIQRILPDAEVRPVRQFTDAQAKIYSRISGILNFTVGVVLVLTALCVMAAMANVAVERRNDVALMKAIGGAKRRVLRFFLTEAALLGVAGGLVGSAVGILFSIWLGKQVFGVAAQPRLIVYPIAVALTTLVAILSAYPLRHLAGVRPAAVFRGEA